MANPPDDLLTIGEHTYWKPRVEWHPGDTGRIRIGRYCQVHSTVTIFVGGEHRTDWVSTYPVGPRFGLPGAFRDGQPWGRGDVTIGNDVYLGFRVVVLSGVAIGDGAVVGTGSLVTKDVEPYSVAAGVPARHVRWRFDEEQRRALLSIKWWNWPDDEVVAAAELLSSDQVDAFIDRYRDRGSEG